MPTRVWPVCMHIDNFYTYNHTSIIKYIYIYNHISQWMYTLNNVHTYSNYSYTYLQRLDIVCSLQFVLGALLIRSLLMPSIVAGEKIRHLVIGSPDIHDVKNPKKIGWLPWGLSFLYKRSLGPDVKNRRVFLGRVQTLFEYTKCIQNSGEK